MKDNTIKVALLGYGTVGSGTYKVLTENAQILSERIGASIKVEKILVQNASKDRDLDAPKNIFTTDFEEIISNPDIDIVAEMMGGLEPATSYMLAAIAAGKHVVSANKAALAKAAKELTKAAQVSNVMLRYEAAVCGAIPVMNAISTALSANKISKVQGIVNGTTNYILTQMDENKAAYENVLKDAQDKGFAEADPTGDVEGYDAANKLTLLIGAAFGEYIDPDDIAKEGITKITASDLEAAAKQNSKIKLIACAEKIGDSMKVSVKPTLVPLDNPLAQVRNEFNAVLISCNMAGDLFLQGRGAGALPTGSAVAGDIAEIAACITRRSADKSLPTWR
ncbi:MAG: homoserine dehydrogenase [Clostridia bacterium]|nr:homoserine dehydrogenase [Clostridia bacterium]